MSQDRGANYCYNDKHIAIYKCITFLKLPIYIEKCLHVNKIIYIIFKTHFSLISLERLNID